MSPLLRVVVSSRDRKTTDTKNPIRLYEWNDYGGMTTGRGTGTRGWRQGWQQGGHVGVEDALVRCREL